MKNLKNANFSCYGGGILGIALLSANLNATELNQICPNPNSCTLPSNYADITNHANLSALTLSLSTHTITNFTNYATMGNISWGDNGGVITNLINYGTMGSISGMRRNPPTTTTITNYGTMGGISTQYGDKDIIIRNYGIINSNGSHQLWGTSSDSYYFVLEAYSMIISENANSFANNRGDVSK